MRGRGSAGRASPCQGEGRGFESRRPLGASLAQSLWGEMFSGWSGREARQRTANPCTRVQIPSPPRAIGAAVARFPDTEEVTGSNPVSPTSNAPSQRPVCDLATRFWRLVRLTRRPNCRPCAVLARRTGSAGVHLHGYSRRAVRPRCSSRCPVPRARVALTGT